MGREQTCDYVDLVAGFISIPAGALCDWLPVPVVCRVARRAWCVLFFFITVVLGWFGVMAGFEFRPAGAL